MKVIAISSIILFLYLIHSSLSLFCYQCEELFDGTKSCEINVKNVLQMNCTGNFACIKYIWLDNHTSTIKRGCESHSRCEELKAVQTANSSLRYCGICDTDLCNNSPSITVINCLILSLISILLIFKIN